MFVAALILLAAAIILLAVSSMQLALARRAVRRSEELQQLANTAPKEVEAVAVFYPSNLVPETPAAKHRRADVLGELESLGDSTKVEASDALARATELLSSTDLGSPSDLFVHEHKLRDISKLAREGASSGEIARRLHLTIGEVEFLLNLRAA
jgi:hypothetical protein